ncbi:MAG: hypothetical protein MJ061_00650 [Mailhella sp.]|nr:hypothetical protein [Mailhella sp.]
MTAGISALPDEGLRGAEDADIESMLHAAVYEGAPEAACAAVLRHDALHDQLIRGMAPSASAEGGAAEICAALSRTASGRREDGIIVLPAHQGVFVMYAPTVEHLRDLLYMLGQGYIPM